MKLFIVLAVLIAVVVSEPCRDRDDCRDHHVTRCHHGSDVTCLSGQCTCFTRNDHNIACGGLADCVNANLNCRNGETKHCVDGFCSCTH